MPSRTNTRYPGSTYSTRDSTGRIDRGGPSGFESIRLPAPLAPAGRRESSCRPEETRATRRSFRRAHVRLSRWRPAFLPKRRRGRSRRPVEGKKDLSTGSPGPVKSQRFLHVRHVADRDREFHRRDPRAIAFPTAKKPMERPSGDQKGDVTFSVPGIARASGRREGT